MLSNRRANKGFTLLEALLAAAILSLFAFPIIGAFSAAAEQDQRRLAELVMHEFAISLLEERVATRDFEPGGGTYEKRFAYTVSANPYDRRSETRFDDLISFTQLTVSVQLEGSAFGPVEVSQIVARKAE